jgi:single-stranded-DNA-specific exonuclease
MRIVERKYSPTTALALVREGVPPIVARALAARGIKQASEIAGRLTDLIHYRELLNAREMAEILADAIVSQKRLLIVADYDADGATACTIGMRALQAYGANVGFIIPNRIEQGYGLTPEIVDIAAGLVPRPDYIVTVDNGISSTYGIDRANELGIEVLVTDHHLQGDTLPNARIIVNPNQNACRFPSKGLAGCGVIWYVMWALRDVMAERGIPQANPNFKIASLAPILAVGTVADVVSLAERNNRILVHEGLRYIKSGRSFPGIDALARVANKDPLSLVASDIGFGVGPHINAAGRLETMDAGVECLLTDSPERAAQLANELHEINMRRREIEAEIVNGAVEQLIGKVDLDYYTAVLHGEEWHQGVIGIVASRIKDRVYRPTFVMANGKNGEVKGSGRSIPGFHLRDALALVAARNPDLLPKFGGHAMAAGVTVRAKGLRKFQEAFEEAARELLSPALLNQCVDTDGSLEAAEMSLETVAMIKKYVWGQNFLEPCFCDEFNLVSFKKMGKDDAHLKMVLERGGQNFDAVKFRHEGNEVPARVRVVYKLDANVNPFNKKVALQLMVEYFEAA